MKASCALIASLNVTAIDGPLPAKKTSAAQALMFQENGVMGRVRISPDALFVTAESSLVLFILTLLVISMTLLSEHGMANCNKGLILPARAARHIKTVFFIVFHEV